jgi:hypothetical protein
MGVIVLQATFLVVASPHPQLARGDEPAGSRSSHDELHAKYAEARLKLAELDLEKATLLEGQGSGRIVSDQDWRRLRSRVAVLQEIAEATRKQPHGTGIEGQRARARAAVTVADADLEQARNLHDLKPTAFTALAVQRHETKAEIARLRVALWEDPANVPSIIDEMQMQIDQLTDHVVDLLDQIENNRIIDSLRP